jgi:predicted RNA methylase
MTPPIAPTQIAALLLQGSPISDEQFDSIYPSSVIRHSSLHWTPVRVAQTAAMLLRKHGREHVLDVGSGCGKFCLVMTMSTSLYCYGVEQRPWLHQAAIEAAEKLKVTKAAFFCVDALHLDWQRFDAIYFFNPFFEEKEPTIRMDQELPFSEARFNACQATVKEKLLDQKRGSMVLTYHGLGAPLPKAYQLVDSVPSGTQVLELWQRR